MTAIGFLMICLIVSITLLFGVIFYYADREIAYLGSDNMRLFNQVMSLHNKIDEQQMRIESLIRSLQELEAHLNSIDRVVIDTAKQVHKNIDPLNPTPEIINMNFRRTRG